MLYEINAGLTCFMFCLFVAMLILTPIWVWIEVKLLGREDEDEDEKYAEIKNETEDVRKADG